MRGKVATKEAEEVGRHQIICILVGCATEFQFYCKHCGVMEAFEASKSKLHSEEMGCLVQSQWLRSKKKCLYYLSGTQRDWYHTLGCFRNLGDNFGQQNNGAGLCWY